MAALPIPTSDWAQAPIMDQVTADTIQAPATAFAVTAEPAVDTKPELDLKPLPSVPPRDNSKKSGEPEWVTHSGVEGRPYLTEEIYDSEDRVELSGSDRCKPCADLNRSCVTVLKFPNPPALGDLDVCGYCARDGKKRCGAGKNAYQSHLRKQIEEEAKAPISKRIGRRISKPHTSPLSPDMSSNPDGAAAALASAAATGITRRRSNSIDTTDSEASAPKRQKVAFRRKPGPKPKVPTAAKIPGNQEATSSTFPITDENDPNYDGRKDPTKVALRVEKMKATLLAKKLEKQAAQAAVRSAEKPKAPAAAARASGGPQTDPKPVSKALQTIKKPRAINQTPVPVRNNAAIPAESDYLGKNYGGSSAKGGRRKVRDSGKKVLAAHRVARRKRPHGSQSDVEMEVNALLGSIEQPESNGLAESDDSSDLSSFGDLETEHEKLKRVLAKAEARDKKERLREENEAMKKRIDELKRKSLTRRDSSSVLPA